jgi:predicted N-acetyltransferase YhbS
MSEIIIRSANIEDMPSIHSLVKELAVYENAEHEMIIDIEYYKNEFGRNTFQSIVAEMNNEVVGTCIYYMTYSTWKGRMLYLEDFIVKEKYRKQKIGQQLFDAFLAEAKSLEATMVKWQVLDWNEPAIKFYEKNHSKIEKEWWNCKIIF